MNRKLTFLLIAFVCALAATAQPFDGKLIVRGNHHTQRLPGVNERRMERLEKMRQENITIGDDDILPLVIQDLRVFGYFEDDVLVGIE
ncbi:MAG: hypothetical protein II279_05660 [Bacteroidaceae bacterium]|nr:hypothetical protein [Bacteroidaceae bacterium]